MRVWTLHAILLVLPVAVAAQTYKCKNADGKVSFQDRPCQGNSSGGQVVVKPTAPSADAAELAKMKADASASRDKSLEQHRLQQEVRDRNRQIDAHNRAVNCERARQALGTLKSQRPVFRYDNNGERQYIEDSKRQAEISAAQQAVAEHCS